MQMLGMVTLTHDTGLAMLRDGKIILVLEEERHSREKHTMQFPSRSLDACFRASGTVLSDIDLITTPWDQNRLRRTFAKAIFNRLPGSLHLVRDSAHPTQDGAVVVMNAMLRYRLKRQFPRERIPRIVGIGHHESHASMFFVSPFEDATVIVMDGYGDDASTSIFTGTGNHLVRQWHGHLFDSLGMVYSLVTRHLGFQIFEEGTVMALAALGDESMVEQMRNVIRLLPDGSFAVDMSYFSYDTFGLIKPFTAKFFHTFGPARQRHDPLERRHQNLARALQVLAEDVVLHVAQSARRRFPSPNLCLVGGVALNCVANARLKREAGFDRIWVPPCASDTGAPLGSALYHHHQIQSKPRQQLLDHAYYGLEYDEAQVVSALKSAGLTFEVMSDAQLIDQVARDLAAGLIVGWFQGRYEIGPRALGNRSILASPIAPGVRDVLNSRVKFREPFRPFAPSVLAERANEFFETDQPDPFMTFAPRVRPDKASQIPAAVHVDGTARIQTVERRSNARYHALISRFAELTGIPILLNTSFNKQEPVVAQPAEAISCFLRTEMHVLVLGNCYTTDRPPHAVSDARASFEIIEPNMRGGE